MVQDTFKIDNFSQLKDKIQSNRDVRFDPNYFSRSNLSNEKLIREAMEEAGALNLIGQEMPHWEGPFRTGKHLDVGAHLSGRERCMYRKSALPNGDMLSGRRIVCQLALLGDESLENILRRALPSIALAAKLTEEGHTVSLMFCWSSYRHGGGCEYGRPSFVWVEAKDLSIRTMAQVMDPEFFRSWIFAFRSNSGPNGQLGHGYHGGHSATIQDHSAFVEAAKKFGVLQTGDICLNWSLPIKKQIAMGMQIVEND